MKRMVLAGAVAAALCGVLAAADGNEATAREVLALERTTLDGWQMGNPDPLLAISDPRSPTSTSLRTRGWMACRR